MYARMAAEARAEGFTEIALRFEMVGKVEAEHEERYLTILQSIENKKVFLKEGEVAWKCRNCGHIHIGKQAPVMCPLCAHPQGYFEVMSKNY
jgi:rubrerythrin